MDEKEIRKQAKKIMDDFAAALEKAGVKEKNVFVERKEDRREEKDEECDNEFREIMLANAPEVRDDFLIGEKGGWGE